MPFQFGLDKARMHDSAEIICISRRILAFKASGLTTGPIFPVSLKVPLGRFGGGFFWQRFECKKASRWKMRCAGSSGRYIIKEVKRHSYYLKPGEKKRVKAALARKRNRKKARKEAD
jgi:hypothetical protein